MGPLILASQSPRRLALLRAVGLAPEVAPQDVDETPAPNESPTVYALRVATAKARACPGEPVLAADTIVALDGAILGKAANLDEAIATLGRLSGRTHAVHTAVVLRAGRTLSQIVSTAVRFRFLGAEEIAGYAAGGEWTDKAGAYGIQGQGAALVAAIEGSFTNVIGLPLEETLELLKLGRVIG